MTQMHQGQKFKRMVGSASQIAPVDACPTSPVPLLVCCEFGDPNDPTVWSGTPLHLCRALDRNFAEVERYNGDVPGGYLPRKIVRGLSYLCYRGSYQHHRGRVVRWVRARMLHRHLKPRHRDVLHLGAGHLPLIDPGDGRRHYLYLDTTFHLWSRFSTRRGMWKSRLAADTDNAERRAYRQMTHVFTIGRHVSADLVDHYGVDPDRITCVGTGRGRIKPFYGEKDRQKPTLLFVAKNRFEDKGGDLVIDAFKQIRRADPRVRLTIVGQPQYLDTLERVDGMTTLGHIPQDTLEMLFHEASLFVMPARNEPWGLVYLEALASRTPIVMLDRNAAAELTGEGRYGFRAAEPTATAVADTVLEALSDPTRLERMGRAGQAHCLEYYTWSATARRMGRVILEYVQQESQP